MPRLTPMRLINAGDDWELFYDYSVRLQKTSSKLPGIYCLFVKLEMYLKAYIVLKDPSYANPDKLKSLQHNYGKILKVFKGLAHEDLSKMAADSLNEYGLLKLNINELKYPNPSIGGWQINQQLYEGHHKFTPLFMQINQEASSNLSEWLKANPI